MHEVLERLRRELAEGVGGLTAEQTQVRPGAGRWSIQQVVEHLTLSYGASSAVVETRLEKGTATKARPTLGQRVGQFVITRMGLFPGGRKAPLAVMPREVAERLSGEEMAEEVEKALRRMDGLLMQAEAMFGGARAISHVVLGPMSVRQWRRFHLVHGEHHLRQIAAARAGLGRR